MIQLWIVVALMTQACKDKQNEVIQETTVKSKYNFVFETTPRLGIEFREKDLQQPFQMNMNRNGLVIGVMSRGAPKFTLAGDVSCYDVRVGSVPWSGVAP